MRHLGSDLRFGLRMLARHPTLSIVAILTFGLGLGLATAVFSVVNGALYKGLPFEQADRLVLLVGTNATRNLTRTALSVHDLAAIAERQRVFESFGPFEHVPVNLSLAGGDAERFEAVALGVGALQATRVRPALGRTFREGDDRAGAEPVLLLGYQLWQERFGGSPDVIGKVVRASGVARTIVGVMPKGFAFLMREQVFIPLVTNAAATPRGDGPTYVAFARLRPDMSMRGAKTELAAVMAGVEKQFPDTNRGIGASVIPVLDALLGSQLYGLLYTMLAAGIGVLLIACVNVSNLLVARASLREREVAVRLALGAGRRRVVAQMFTEVALLALAGAVVGLLISVGSIHWIVAAIQSDPPPFFITFGLDVRVLLFVTAVTLASAMFAGLLPALQATRPNIAGALKDAGRSTTGFRGRRFSSALVVAELTVSCALLVAAGLMVKSVAQVRTVDLPFAVEGITTARLSLPKAQYPDPEARVRFLNALHPSVVALPGVQTVALADGLPGSPTPVSPVQIGGRAYTRDADYPMVCQAIVTPGYFDTFKAKVVRGREFTDADQPGRQLVALVNESFARRFFKGTDPIGQQIRKGRGRSDEPWLTVVGVVGDMMMRGFANTSDSQAGYYIPLAQSKVGAAASIVIHGNGGPAAVLPGLRAAIRSLGPDVAISEVQPMQGVVDRLATFFSVFGTFFFAFGVAGLFLAAAGLYGVMSFAVTRRTREFGIRAALGARGGQLVLLVMRQAVVQSLVGLTLGGALGLLAANGLQPYLFRVDPRDPLVLGLAVLALAATGLATGLVVAKRVARLDPVTALGQE